MATTRPFAYNIGSTVPGTEQVGNVSAGTPTSGFDATGLRWRGGPDEDLGYVIAYTATPPRTAGNGIENITLNDIGYKRSLSKTESSFIDLANFVHGATSFASGSLAKTWLNANGYWTSYTTTLIGSTGLILNYDLSYSSSYPGTGNTITDLQANSNATLNNSPTFSSNNGGYLTLNGSNQYIGTNTSLVSKLNNTSYATSTITSVFVWAYPMDNGVIVSELGQTTPNSGWHDSQIEMVAGTLKFSVWQNTPGFSSTIATPLNNWYYMGFVATSSTLIGYVNGATAFESSAGILPARLTPGNNSYGLYYAIGATDSTNLGDGTPANMRFGGMHIYNTALTYSEVVNNFNATKTRFGL